MSVVDIAITVDRDRSLDEALLSAVKKAGFVVDRAMPRLGTIYGHGPAEGLDVVKSIQGVVGVREAGRYQLAPVRRGVPQ